MKLVALLFTAVCVAAAPAASDVLAVKCQSTKGDFTIAVNTKWAPVGAQRFLALVEDGFFTDHALYRAVDNFLIQFGVAADPKQQRKWLDKGNIGDDPDLKLAFKFGMLSYAGSGPRSRDTSVFLAISHNPGQLAAFGTQLWERPIGFVSQGLDVLSNFYTGYGDMKEIGGE